VDNSTLPSASSSSSRSVADAAEEEEEELMITTNLVAPDEVVRSLLGGEEARRELDTRVGRVVRETGVVGLAVEEVIRTLSRAVTGMVDQPEWRRSESEEVSRRKMREKDIDCNFLSTPELERWCSPRVGMQFSLACERARERDSRQRKGALVVSTRVNSIHERRQQRGRQAMGYRRSRRVDDEEGEVWMARRGEFARVGWP
jgi:hypothetical protein